MTVTKTRVTVHDSMQHDYSYVRTEPVGKNFHADFRPMLTPKEMLELGIFGGLYLNSAREEFPSDWFRKAKLSQTGKQEKSLNYFGVHASKDLQYWRDKGWIHADDPRGWFQWYCRYYMGRRHEDDERQIKRWRNITRHIGALQKACDAGDEACQPRRRQALLHWAYDSRVL